MKLHEVKGALAKATAELEDLAGKSAADGFSQELYDALLAKIDELKLQKGRLEQAQTVAAALSQPIPGQERMTPRAPARAVNRLYSSLKNFQDREIEGRVIRAVDQAYTAGMWFKAVIWEDKKAQDWCKTHGIAIEKAHGEQVDSAGGFLVPEEVMANIIVLREKFGIFRQNCQVVPMGRDLMNWPRRVGGLTAFFMGENTQVTESQAAWDNITLAAKKVGTLTRFSTELEEDATISIADLLIGEIAYAFAAKEDDCGWNGDATGTFGGIRGACFLATDGNHNASKYTAAGGHNTFATIDMTDITGLMGILPQYALENAKWYMSQVAFHTTVGRLVSTAGGNRIDTLTGAAQYQFLGFPVVISQKLPLLQTSLTTKAMFFFGDLSRAAALGERRVVTIRRSDHRYFENDQIGLLGTERMDINVHDIGDNLTAGPLVAMVAP